MNIYFLMTDEPVYSPITCRIFLKKYADKIAGISFPPGAMNKKRIISTMRIYGLRRFFSMSIYHMLWMIRGGRIANIFHQYQAKVYSTENINSPVFIDLLKNLRVDLIISFNCPQVFRKELIAVPAKGCINVHFGMLPKYRGIQPIMHALLNGEKEFGVTVHYIDEKLDSGDIIIQEKIPISEKDILDTLYPKAFETAGHLLVRVVDMIVNDTVKRIYNDPSKKSYYTYPRKETIKQYRRLCHMRQR